MIKIIIPASMQTTLRHLKLAGRPVTFLKEDEGIIEPTGDSVIRIRSSEIPDEVDDSRDVGLCGSDWLVEKYLELGIELEVLNRYQYGREFHTSPSLDLVVPQSEYISSVEQIKPGTMIRTEHPFMTRKFLEEHGLRISRRGEPETPRRSGEFRKWCEQTGMVGMKIVHGKIGVLVGNVRDFGVMVNETGATLRDNNLRVLDTLHKIETCLIADQDAVKREGQREEIEGFQRVLDEAYCRYLDGESEAAVLFFKERGR